MTLTPNYPFDDTLFQSEEITTGNVKTTYLWTSILWPDTAEDWLWDLWAEAIWQIIKIIETTSWGTVSSVFQYPVDDLWRRSTKNEFVRDNRATLTYK